MTISLPQLESLCDIALASGQEVMAVYASDFTSWQKADASPLTEADLRADAVIRERLEVSFPGVFILSEESVSAGIQAAETFFLVDPLDGTKEFLKRSGEFTVNIALIQKSRVIAGVVFAPAIDELFFAAIGLGAWKIARGQKSGLRTMPSPEGQPLRIVGSRSHGIDRLEAWLAGLVRPFTFKPAGSSLKFCRIAEGSADMYPRFGLTSQWDTAAAQCVLEVAGGYVVDFSGESLRYGLDRPILNPGFVAMAARGLDV